jgi:hypothetical protein
MEKNSEDVAIAVLVEQVERLMKEMVDVKKSLWEDDGDDMGLIPRVQRHTDLLSEIKWIARGIFVAVIIQIILSQVLP